MATESSQAQQPHTDLSRDLSLFDITMVGVAGMIGAGIFVLTGHAAGVAGPALILAFALNGIVTVFTGMVYAELGSAIPEAGGGYLWVKEGLPGSNAFLAGWMSWFAHAVAGSLYALGFGAYLELFLQQFGISVFGLHGNVLHKVLATLIIITFVYINYRGATEMGKMGNIVTMAKLLVIGLFVACGLAVIFKNPDFLAKFSPPSFDPGIRPGFAPYGISGIIMAMGLTFIAFEGYEIIVQAGEEVKNPRRNIPKAVFLALAIVVPLYMLVAFVSVGAVTLPPDSTQPTTWQWLAEQKEVGLGQAAGNFMPFGAIIMSLGGLLSTMSALNATTYSSTRVSFAMGRDHNLPDMFGLVHPRTRIPHIALLLSGLLMIVMAVGAPIKHVASATDIMFLLLFLQVNVAVITIRKRYGDKLSYGYLTPFFPYVPILGIITKFFIAVFMFNYSPLAWYVAIGWIGAGVLIYRLYGAKRQREKEITPVVIEERARIDRERFSVLVAVGHPQRSGNLLTVAGSILQVEPGDLMLLHVITVPDQLPVSVGRDFVDEVRPTIDQAARQAEGMGMSPTCLVRVGHRPADAIIDTVEETQANFVVLGWQGRVSDPQTLIGTNIDRIVKEAHANVVVVRGDVTLPAGRILVPVQHPAHGHLVSQFATPLLGPEEGYIEMLHVVDPQLSPHERAQRAATLRDALRRLHDEEEMEANERPQRRVRIRIAAGDVVEEVVRRSEDFDLVILGASRESWIRRTLWGNKTQRIAARIQCPLMLVNLRAGRLKFGVSKFFQFFWDIHEGVEE